MTAARLLVVDDDRAFRVSTAALLRAEGFEVDVADSGAAGVELLRAAAADTTSCCSTSACPAPTD
jgi:DNA-binding response OmpR family regulator